MRVLFLRPTTVLALGAGFLLGSRAGPGPWEFAAAKVREVQGGRSPSGDVNLADGSQSHPDDARMPFTST